jgi:hypothetical protein
MGYNNYQKGGHNRKTEYKKYRARTPIKTFRDLEIYKNTTFLSADIFNIKIPEKYRKNEKVKNELNILYDISKTIPRYIAEGHSRKFENLEAGMKKLENAAEATNLIISKIDFLSAVVENDELKEKFSEWIQKYQQNKRRILNLKRSWGRIFGSGNLGKGWNKHNQVKKNNKK